MKPVIVKSELVMVTEDDLTAALRDLHDSIRRERQPDEFTINEYYQANSDKVNNLKDAENMLNRAVGNGLIIRLTEKAYINERFRTVFKLVKHD